MQHRICFTAILITVLLATPALVIGQGGGERRVRPPVWSDQDVRGVFFDDAFEEGLVGERPDDLGGTAPIPGGGTPSGVTPGGGTSPPAAGGGFAWSEIISASTLEDEVKASKTRIDQLLTTPGRFAGQDYKVARREFSQLAMLMAIVAEYDGQVRWQQDAAAARDLFSRTAANCKVGTVQVFNEARRRQADLQDMVGGGTLQSGSADAEAAADWEQVVDRVPLMQWLEATETTLLPNTANARQFAANQQQIRHEAELVAAVATVLGREGMEDTGDDEYDAFCQQLQQAARAVSEAVQQGSARHATEAVGEMTKSCSACHELYRG